MKNNTEEYDPNYRIESAAAVADGTEAEVFMSQVATFLKQFADNGGFVHKKREVVDDKGEATHIA
jgi:hypothetical protein